MILDWLQFSPSHRRLLQSLVSNFFHDGVWSFLDYFSTAFPQVVASVRLIVDPFYGSDRVLRKGVADGIPTAKVAYDSLCPVRPESAWCRIICKPYIPPSRFVHCWKVLYNRLTSIFRICSGASKSMKHLFLEYP